MDSGSEEDVFQSKKKEAIGNDTTDVCVLTLVKHSLLN